MKATLGGRAAACPPSNGPAQSCGSCTWEGEAAACPPSVLHAKDAGQPCGGCGRLQVFRCRASSCGPAVRGMRTCHAEDVRPPRWRCKPPSFPACFAAVNGAGSLGIAPLGPPFPVCFAAVNGGVCMFGCFLAKNGGFCMGSRILQKANPAETPRRLQEMGGFCTMPRCKPPTSLHGNRRSCKPLRSMRGFMQETRRSAWPDANP